MKRAPAAPEAGRPARGADRPSPGIDLQTVTNAVLSSLEDDKAEEILAIDIRGRSSFADMLVVASGRSARHVGALADHVMRKLKDIGVHDVRIEGLPQADWVLVDAGDVVVHLFRPEVRAFYNIEKIWAPGAAHTSPLAS
ncbi:MAG: ribosome silencing factor [Hyphomonadaceae bacterium]|nr:ribosome silencing factor [Hyphomonadaceae bacterium]